MRELDGLQAAAGLDGDVVVLAEQRLSPKVCGGPKMPRRASSRMSEVLRSQAAVVSCESFSVMCRKGMSKRTPLNCGVEGLDELRFQQAHVLRLARPHAPKLVCAPLAR